MKKFEDILVQCIDDIKAGRSSIEDCLDRYPSMRERLEPLLRIALGIREPPDVKPSAAFKVKARVWLMDQIHGRQAVTKRPWSRYDSQTKPTSYVRRFSMAGVVLAIVLVLCAAGGSTVYAAQDSLPGDALYPVKLGTEQVIMILPGDDVAKADRALSFAERRVREMEALAEKGRSQDLELAVEKYGYALKMTMAAMGRARNGGLVAGNVTARVAETMATHLYRLDMLGDIVPDAAKSAIARARETAERGRQNALAALANDNAVRAAEMNLAAMLGRLNRVRAKVQDGEALQIALQQFEDMAGFGQEISQITEETGLNIAEVAELVTEATSMHLEVLAELYEEVPEQAKKAIEQAMEQSFRGYERMMMVLERTGVEDSELPVIPEEIRQRMEDILGWTNAPKAGIPTGGSPGQSCPCCGGR